MKKVRLFSLFLAVFVLFACKKPGTGGKAQISGKATYNGAAPASAIVYIKYGTSTSPGTDPTLYDSQQTADAQGNFSFISLTKGDYYIYVTGYYINPTTQYQIHISGGTEAHIPKSKSSVTYNVTLQ